MTLYQIKHFPEQMTAGDVVTPANMLSFGEYETPEQAVRDIIRWFLDRDTTEVKLDYQAADRELMEQVRIGPLAAGPIVNAVLGTEGDNAN